MNNKQDKIFEKNPFFLNREDKKDIFYNEINKLTKHHYLKSNSYKKILKGLNYKLKNCNLENLPFLTTNVFKDLKLVSVNEKKIFKTLSSSGTSGSKTSKIYLDKNNANRQRIVLTKIFEHHFGNSRLPMLIISKNPNIIRDKFDAKIAAILGFSIFGKNHTYILEENGDVNFGKLQEFLKKFSKKKFFMFGFTYEVFQTFFKKIKNNQKINLKNAILIHGGGWKKLEKNKISNINFKKKFNNKYNLTKIFNYYGLIEQIGSIFFECPKCNLFVCSDFSEIFIRDKNFNILNKGKGLVQLLSLLPKSYPGHNILTEDIGEIITNKNSSCNHKGKCFKIYGRVENSIIRGCSDV